MGGSFRMSAAFNQRNYASRQCEHAHKPKRYAVNKHALLALEALTSHHCLRKAVRHNEIGEIDDFK